MIKINLTITIDKKSFLKKLKPITNLFKKTRIIPVLERISETSFKRPLATIFAVIVLAFVLSFGIHLVMAWTEPTVNPPSGNVNAPINVSSTTQTKAGDLAVRDLTVNGWDIYGPDTGNLRLNSINDNQIVLLSDNHIYMDLDNDGDGDGKFLIRNDADQNVVTVDEAGHITMEGNITMKDWSQIQNTANNLHFDAWGGNMYLNWYSRKPVYFGDQRAWINGTGDVNGNRLCIAGVCRSSWPSGGIAEEQDTLDSVVKRGNETDRAIYIPGFYDYNDTSKKIDPAGDSYVRNLYGDRYYFSNVIESYNGKIRLQSDGNLVAEYNVWGTPITIWVSTYPSEGWTQCPNGFYMVGIYGKNRGSDGAERFDRILCARL